MEAHFARILLDSLASFARRTLARWTGMPLRIEVLVQRVGLAHKAVSGCTLNEAHG